MSVGQDQNGDTVPRHESPRPGARLRQAITAASHRYDPGTPWNGTRRRAASQTTIIDDLATEDPVITVDLSDDGDLADTDDLADDGDGVADVIDAAETDDRASIVAEPLSAPVAPAPASRSSLVDLRPARQTQPYPARSGPDFGLGSRWGADWAMARQGWVDTGTGRPTWRPIVATTDRLEQFDIDTYLGVINAEVAISLQAPDARTLGRALARARQLGVEGLVEEAVERGAHAVIGTSMQYTSIGERLLVTYSGTAVTLRERV